MNDWEINEPVAQVRLVEGKNPEIVAVSVRQHYMLAIPDGWAESLEKLASTLADRLEGVYEKERQRVLEFARGMSIEEITRRRNAPSRIPGLRDVAEARGRQ